MQYPISLSFKIIALAPQIYVRDAQETPLLYVKQKLFKLKEQIHVYRDDSKTQELFHIGADRIIDFSAKYTFRDAEGREVGAVKRRGARSIWKASYDVFDAAGSNILTIQEDNAWIKLLDALIGEIPVIGAFTGYFLNPTYLVKRAGTDEAVLKVVKRRSFLESKFNIESEGSGVQGAEEVTALLAILMMVLLERSRG